MARLVSRDAHERWLVQLTDLPSVSGKEDAVITWVTQWVRRRRDLTLARDRYGNLYITQNRQLRSAPIWLTAHMDHPGFVATSVDGSTIAWEFRGGVRDEYYSGAVVEWLDKTEVVGRSRIEAFERTDAGMSGTSKRLRGSPVPAVGAIGRWHFAPSRLGISRGRLRANACDDLAGVAAALAVLDQSRAVDQLSDVGVILTRAEEMGFVGAIGAAKGARIPARSRLVCIEMSRALPDAPLGAGPVVRVGDASSVFSPGLTNALATLAAEMGQSDGLASQRKLMTGGSCEATAFVAYGHTAACVCLPLGNYHNMGELEELEEVERRRSPAPVAPEEISLADWHGMVDFLVAALARLDEGEGLIRAKLDRRFEASRAIL